MSRFRLLVCLSACISVGALGLAAPAAHADEICTGTMGVGPVVGNVIVPPGASCELLGTGPITGNVQVGQGSKLLTENASVVGNIQGEGATRIRIYNTAVTDIQLKKVTYQIIIGSDRTCQADPLVLGRIQLEENSANIGICKMSTRQDVQLTKNTGRILVDDNTIGEDLQVAENTQHVRIRFNEVGENIEVIKNTGGVLMNGNTAGMRIQCSDNAPPPISYVPNTAPSKEGQCAGL